MAKQSGRITPSGGSGVAGQTGAGKHRLIISPTDLDVAIDTTPTGTHGNNVASGQKRRTGLREQW